MTKRFFLLGNHKGKQKSWTIYISGPGYHNQYHD